MIYILHSSDNHNWDFFCDYTRISCNSVRDSLLDVASSLATLAAGDLANTRLYTCAKEDSLTAFLNSFYSDLPMHIYLQFNSMSDLRAYLEAHPEYLL